MKLNRVNVYPSVFWMIRIVLGLTFIYASWHKILNPAEFAKIIYGYDLFPEVTINFFAIWVPYLELIAGGCLVTGILKRPALLIINGLLFIFILIIGFNLLRGHQFDCGCFSVSSDKAASMSAFWLMIRDILLLAGGIFIFRKLSKGPVPVPKKQPS